jgi:hypothetical protein
MLTKEELLPITSGAPEPHRWKNLLFTKNGRSFFGPAVYLYEADAKRCSDAFNRETDAETEAGYEITIFCEFSAGLRSRLNGLLFGRAGPAAFGCEPLVD